MEKEKRMTYTVGNPSACPTTWAFCDSAKRDRSAILSTIVLHVETSLLMASATGRGVATAGAWTAPGRDRWTAAGLACTNAITARAIRATNPKNVATHPFQPKGDEQASCPRESEEEEELPEVQVITVDPGCVQDPWGAGGYRVVHHLGAEPVLNGEPEDGHDAPNHCDDLGPVEPECGSSVDGERDAVLSPCRGVRDERQGYD
jgi:hypothetical protein